VCVKFSKRGDPWLGGLRDQEIDGEGWREGALAPPSRGLGGGLEVVAQQFLVEVAVFIDPLLVDLDRGRPHEPQATVFNGEDAHQQGAPVDLLVEAFEQVGRPEVVVVGARQTVKGERFLEVGFDPVAELAVHTLPAGQPLGQVPAGFGHLVQIGMSAGSRLVAP
jgi:hypothetical protein